METSKLFQRIHEKQSIQDFDMFMVLNINHLGVCEMYKISTLQLSIFRKAIVTNSSVLRNHGMNIRIFH